MLQSNSPIVSFALYTSATINGYKKILLRVYFKGFYKKRSTGLAVKVEDWDAGRQRVSRSCPDASSINSKLKELYDRTVKDLESCNGMVTLQKIDMILGGQFVSDADRPKLQPFVEFASEYNQRRYERHQIQTSTYKNNISYIKSFAVFERYKGHKTMTIGGVSPLVFEEYIDYRINVKMNTNMELVDKALVPLYQAVDYARRLGYVDDVVAAKILENRLKFREVKYAQAMELEGPVKYLTEDRIEALEKYYSSCRNTTLREAVQLFLFSYYACGLRLSDVMTLQWDHINPESRTFRKVQVKTKKLLPMEMPLCRKALAILKEWKGRNPVFVFDLLSSSFDLRNSEAIYDARNSLDKHMNSALEKVSRELGFERPITFHQARHSFAVMAINKGMRVEVISKLLGHSSIISTEKTYARFLRSTIDDEIKKIMEW